MFLSNIPESFNLRIKFFMKFRLFVFLTAIMTGLCATIQADELSPSGITNTVMRGASTNFTVAMTNTTGSALYWQAVNATTSSWVSLSSESGIIEDGATSNLVVTNNALTLSGGAYTGQLAVYLTNAAYNSTGTVDMTLNVAEFGRSLTNISKTIRQNGVTNFSLQIWNNGAGILSYTIQTNQSWLVVSPSSGSLTGQIADATNTLDVVITNTTEIPTLGHYYGTITLVSDIDGSTLPIYVDLTVAAGPQMLVTPQSFTGSVMMGQSPGNQTFYVSNGSSTDQVCYGVSVDADWLTVTPTNGSLSPQETNALTISYQTANLTTNSYGGPSNYNATITIASTNTEAVGSPTYVTVNMTVNPRARLALSLTSLSNTVTEGYNVSSSKFDIWNGNGYYTLSYTINDDVDWLEFSPSSGTSTGEHNTITVDYNTLGFAPGASNATITITAQSSDGTHSTNAFESPQTIYVFVNVVPLAVLSTDSQNAYSFSAKQGQSVDSATFHVWSGGSGGKLAYSIATNATWMSLSPASGTSEGELKTITLSCQTAGLRPGLHTGMITISGIDYDRGSTAYNSPTNITVNLTIIGPGKGFDFGGNRMGASDLVVYEETTGLWDIENLLSGYTTNVTFGGMDFVPCPADYSGDGLTDLGVYSHATGHCYARELSSQQLAVFGGGYWVGPASASLGGFVPITGDYDGDGLADPAMYNQSSGTWSLLLSGSGYDYSSMSFGGSGYTAIPADFDGDGIIDPAVYNELSSLWYVLFSGDNYSSASGNFGGPGYTAAPADFDGDGLADACVYKESTGLWIVLPSSTATSSGGYSPVSGIFGGPGFVPVPADYTGDGLADAAVYDTATGEWYIVELSGARVAWRHKHGGYGFTPVKP